MDPVKVVKTALRYGSGLASILLTAEASIVEDDFDEIRNIHQQIKL
jgi:chaperonin GroEL (HSP60 family)